MQELLVGDVMDRQQLDRGDAELAEVRDRGFRRETGIRAAQVVADVQVLRVNPFTCTS